jgi:hypothetical protein
MKIYNYDKQTGELLSESIARENPLEQGEYLVPANATTKEPIVSKEGFITVFKDDEWVSIEDIRGTWYNIREEVEVTSLNHDMTGLTKEPVPYTTEELAQQAELEATKENSLKNQEIQAQIDSLEKTLIRPLRELLSTSTSDETKNAAQTKVDEIEAQIETLRSQFVSIEE